MENFKAFARTRPPVIIFTICLAIFAAILMSLSNYIETHDIKNIDLEQDWNTVLESFSQLEFCSTGNLTTLDETSHVHTPQHLNASHSVIVKIELHPNTEFKHSHVTSIQSVIHGKQLGAKGIQSLEPVLVTISWGKKNSKFVKCNKNKICQKVFIDACVTFKSTSTVFPKSDTPIKCNPPKTTKRQQLPVSELYVNWHSKKDLFVLGCDSHLARFSVVYNLDPKLTVMLTSNDKAIISNHLRLLTVFLVFMIVSFLLWGSVHGGKVFHPQQRLSVSEDADLHSI